MCNTSYSSQEKDIIQYEPWYFQPLEASVMDGLGMKRKKQRQEGRAVCMYSICHEAKHRRKSLGTAFNESNIVSKVTLDFYCLTRFSIQRKPIHALDSALSVLDQIEVACSKPLKM